MAGGTIRYVPLQPPKHGATKTSSAADWTIDMDELEKAINSKTKMIVSTFPTTFTTSADHFSQVLNTP